MRILAIDPGPSESAYVHFDTATGTPVIWEHLTNGEMLNRLTVERLNRRRMARPTFHLLAVEMIASYGMPVGAEVFDTCVWIGRFVEAWGDKFRLIPRAEIKLHLCHDKRAKDSNIRAALIDLWGGKANAIGNKASPGPLYGVKGDVWAALAVARYVADTGGMFDSIPSGSRGLINGD